MKTQCVYIYRPIYGGTQYFSFSNKGWIFEEFTDIPGNWTGYRILIPFSVVPYAHFMDPGPLGALNLKDEGFKGVIDELMYVVNLADDHTALHHFTIEGGIILKRGRRVPPVA